MPTYVSIVNWTGDPRPSPADVSGAVTRALPFFRRRGLNSLALVPDEGACAAVMVARGEDERAVARLAASIVPGAEVHVESMRFDDEPALPEWIARDVRSPRRAPGARAHRAGRDYRRALLVAVCGG